MGGHASGPDRPSFIIEGQHYSLECHNIDQGCDLEFALRYARRTGVDGLPATNLNIAALACHGLRPRTDAERSDTKLLGRSEHDQICDVEIVYVPMLGYSSN